MKNWFALFAACLLMAVPAWAQLGYQTGSSNSTAAPMQTENLPTVVKRTRTNGTVERPDWYALFVLWAKAHPDDLRQGLQNPKAFDNFAQFLACDWVRDYRQNDVAWPARQTQILQQFNQRLTNPQMRFKLLTRGVLGPYMADQQQFVFKPLDSAAFQFEFPTDKLYGMEDDCSANIKISPQAPWPREFVLAFKNPGLISTLPMQKDQAEFFLAALPKNAKGEIDRHVVIDVEFDVADFEPQPLTGLANNVYENSLAPIGVLATARNAVVYSNMQMTKELARYGFAPTATTAPPQ